MFFIVPFYVVFIVSIDDIVTNSSVPPGWSPHGHRKPDASDEGCCIARFSGLRKFNV
jgi:hypothetical protein